MILTDSEVASLRSALRCWEWFGYASTAVVGLGCIGEFFAEFTAFPRSDQRKHKLAKLALIVLILGIAGELLSASRTSQLSGQIIADIEERASHADQKAGDANVRASKNEKEAAQLYKQAEDERLERIKLQAAVAPRSLSRDQQRSIGRACSKFRNHNVWVMSYAMDGEAAGLGGQIIAALMEANVNAEDARASKIVSGGFDWGIHIRSAYKSEAGLDSCFKNAMEKIGRLKVFVNDPLPPQGTGMNGPGIGKMGRPFSSPRTVFSVVMVGVKPVPILATKRTESSNTPK